MAIKMLSPSEELVHKFLERAKAFNTTTELIKVLKSRTYKIGEANVLVRASCEGNRRYFFGINYLTVEEIANLDSPFVAFICGSVDRIVIISAKVLFSHLDRISHDKNGEYKINIDRDLNIVLSGRGNRIDCSGYTNNWNSLLSPPTFEDVAKNTVEESLHSILQGRIIEIGNLRGYQTYCPDKSRHFNDRKIEDITTLKTCPDLQFSDYELLRRIDVLWFTEKGSHLIPEYAFEVELTTGVWSGIGRMATLMNYSNVMLYIIADNAKKYQQVTASLHGISERYKFVSNNALGDLYSAELNLKMLQYEIGL